MHVIFDSSDLKDNAYPENARPHNLKTKFFELYLKTPSADFISPSGKRQTWKTDQGECVKSEGRRLSEAKEYLSKRLTECFRAEVTMSDIRAILMDIAKVIDQL